MDADLLPLIQDQGFAGGFVFEWADEWFKFTWNTIDYELPARPPRALAQPAGPTRSTSAFWPWSPGEHAVVTVDGVGRRVGGPTGRR